MKPQRGTGAFHRQREFLGRQRLQGNRSWTRMKKSAHSRSQKRGEQQRRRQPCSCFLNPAPPPTSLPALWLDRALRRTCRIHLRSRYARGQEPRLDFPCISAA